MRVLVLGNSTFDEYGFLKGMLQTLYAIEGVEIDPDIQWVCITGKNKGFGKVLHRWVLNTDQQAIDYLPEGGIIDEALADIDEVVYFGSLEGSGTQKAMLVRAMEWNMPVHRFTTEGTIKPKEDKTDYKIPLSQFNDAQASAEMGAIRDQLRGQQGSALARQMDAEMHQQMMKYEEKMGPIRARNERIKVLQAETDQQQLRAAALGMGLGADTTKMLGTKQFTTKELVTIMPPKEEKKAWWRK
jgi:hypothetical protein